jgi:hypothetical protein
MPTDGRPVTCDVLCRHQSHSKTQVVLYVTESAKYRRTEMFSVEVNRLPVHQTMRSSADVTEHSTACESHVRTRLRLHDVISFMIQFCNTNCRHTIQYFTMPFTQYTQWSAFHDICGQTAHNFFRDFMVNSQII